MAACDTKLTGKVFILVAVVQLISASLILPLGSSAIPYCENPLDQSALNATTCGLRHYDKANVVSCIDSMLNGNETFPSRHKDKLHFLFVGDSRIRMQFHSFLKVLVFNYQLTNYIDSFTRTVHLFKT